MDGSEAIRKAAFIAAVIAALHQLRQHRNQQKLPDRRFFPHELRNVIHEGGPAAAAAIVSSIFRGSDRRFIELFRITKFQFKKLLIWLQNNADFKATKYQSCTQKLMIFLWIIAHNESQRNAAHRFHVTQSSISKTFQVVLRAMVKLFRTFVKLPAENWLSPDIEFDIKMKDFSGCIGAIDGTHIHAYITTGFISQNVFAAVRPDGTFSYVLAGAEGSMHDSNLCAYAFQGKFFIPRDRFYLADSGFGKRKGLIVPWKETRYHLQEWRVGARGPLNAKELYNLRHSRIRVTVEQTFGILKRQWKIIRSSAPEYGLKSQIRIIYAICGLHNFIRMDRVESIDNEADLTAAKKAILSERRQQAREKLQGKDPQIIRYEISRQMWSDYRNYLTTLEEKELSSESEGCFYPLKRAYGKAIEDLMRAHHTHISKEDFFAAFNATFLTTFIKENIRGGFRGAVIAPHYPENVILQLDMKFHTPSPPNTTLGRHPPWEISWQWLPFTSSARTDNLELYHWTVDVVRYTDEEYAKYLTDPNWTRQETDQLFDLCEQFDLRFIIIADRFTPSRSAEDLKNRYYSAARAILLAKAPSPEEVADHPLVKDPYNIIHEVERKRALANMFSQSRQQEREDAEVLAEAKRITEARLSAKNGDETELPVTTTSISAPTGEIEKVSTPVGSASPSSIPQPPVTVAAPPTPSSTGISTPAGLRLLRVYLRTTVLGQLVQATVSSSGVRTVKRIDNTLQELGVHVKPKVPTKAVCTEHLELRKEILTFFNLQKQEDINKEYLMKVQWKESEVLMLRENPYADFPPTPSTPKRSHRGGDHERASVRALVGSDDGFTGERVGKREHKRKAPARFSEAPPSPPQSKRARKMKASDS